MFRDVDDPAPQAGEVLVKVEAVGICGSDMHAYHGHDSRRPAPLIRGHEAAGRPPCPYAVEGRWHLSPTRQILSMPPRQGTFAAFVCIPERNIEPIPDAMPVTEAALAEPVAVAWHSVRLGAERLHLPLAAARIVVLGGGAIGVAAAVVARRFGAVDLRVGEVNTLRRRALENSEGFATYAPGSSDEPADNSVDLVIDAVGASATRAAASRIVRPGGIIVHLGLLPWVDGLDIRKITLQEVTFVGSHSTPAAKIILRP